MLKRHQVHMCIISDYGRRSYIDAIRTCRMSGIPGVCRNTNMTAWIRRRGHRPTEREVMINKMYLTQNNRYYHYMTSYQYRCRKAYNLYFITCS
jgi:hypothetical protein